MGYHFNAMSLELTPYTVIDKRYETEANFHQSNQTYNITNFIDGLFIDFLKIVMNGLNATFSIFRRSDPYFGVLEGNF